VKKPFPLGKSLNGLFSLIADEWVSEQILKVVPKKRIYDLFITLRAIIIRETTILDSIVYRVREEADRRGIVLKAQAVSCHARRCGTCRGKDSVHYPYFFIIKNGGWRKVKERDLKEFLRSVGGLDERQIEIFYSCRDSRHYLLACYNYLMELLLRLGLISIAETAEEEWEVT